MPEVKSSRFVAALASAERYLVGFTGSGQQMRKDPGRSRHIYQQGGDDEI